MIYDKLSRIAEYKGIHPDLDIAIDYIFSHRHNLPKEHLDLKGTDVYANIASYDTVPDEEAFYEAHKKYADIHIMISGKERVAVSDMAELQEEEAHPDRDLWILQGKEEASVILDPSSFLIVFPKEAHKLKMNAGKESEAAVKCAFKVKLV